MEPPQKRQRTKMNVSVVPPFTKLPPEMLLTIFSWIPDLALILGQVNQRWRYLILDKNTDLEIWGAVRLQTWCLHNKDDRLIKYAITARHMATIVKTVPLFWKLCPGFFVKLFQGVESFLKFPGIVWRAITKIHFTPYGDKDFGVIGKQQMIRNHDDVRTCVLACAVAEKQDPQTLDEFFATHIIKPAYIQWAILEGYTTSAIWMAGREVSGFLWEHQNAYVLCAGMKHRVKFLKWIWTHPDARQQGISHKHNKDKLALWTMVHMKQDLWEMLVEIDPKAMNGFASRNSLIYAYFKGWREAFELQYLDRLRNSNIGLCQSYVFYYTMAIQKDNPIKEVLWLRSCLKVPRNNCRKLRDIIMGKPVKAGWDSGDIGTEEATRGWNIRIAICSEPAYSWLIDCFTVKKKKHKLGNNQTKN